MIHFVPDSLDYAEAQPTPYAEAVSRLASLRQALTLIEGRPVQGDDSTVAAGWANAAECARSHFDTASARAVSGAASGIEALALLRAEGLAANTAASDVLAQDIRARLDELGIHFSL